MVISLGQLTLKTKPKSGQQNVAGMHTSGLTNEDIMREMLEQAYDKFELDIQNIQVSCTIFEHNKDSIVFVFFFRSF